MNRRDGRCKKTKKPIMFLFLFLLITSLSVQSVASSSQVANELNGTITILSVLTPESNQWFAKIYENTVLWLDTSEDVPVYTMYHILNGNITTIQPQLSPAWGFPPELYGDKIVWIAENNSIPEIHIFNCSLFEDTTISSMASSPAIFKDVIVWQQFVVGYFDIYLKNLTSGEETCLTPDTSTSDETNPSLSENYVVWQSMNTEFYTTDIYLYSLDTQDTVLITPETNETSEENPKISGDYVVYQGLDPSSYTYDIYVFSIPQNETRKITPYTEDTNEERPMVFGDLVVWTEDELYVYNITSNETHTFLDGEESGYPSLPSIYGNRIVWQQIDPDKGTTDIYLLTMGIDEPPLIADFEQNVTMGSVPLVVQFTDLSTGDPAGWLWNFGDGNNSREPSPEHIYTKEGAYSASLIVNTPYRRAGISMEDLIYAGSPPIPEFSSNTTTGPAPLAVRFDDLSTGSPSEWHWDFGDGSSSNETSPEHTFLEEGKYNITLTVVNEYGSHSITKENNIQVTNGVVFNLLMNIPGIEVNENNGIQNIIINCSMYTPEIQDSTTVILHPDLESSIRELRINAIDGFNWINSSYISGNITSVEFDSIDCTNTGSTNEWNISYTVRSSEYSYGGSIRTAVWGNATSLDQQKFKDIAIAKGLSGVGGVALTAQFAPENISVGTPVTLIIGVNPDWVDEYGWRWCHQIDTVPTGGAVYVDSIYLGIAPLCIGEGLAPGNHTVRVSVPGYGEKTFPITIDDKRDSIHVIRIGDDGTGEVLNTTFIGHDPERNLDLFQAESPNGLSTFGLASLSKSGNILQLINMVFARIAGSGGGGGGGGSSSTSTSPGTSTTSPQATASPPLSQEGTSSLPLEEQPPGPGEPPAPGITSQEVGTSVPQEPAPTATLEGWGGWYPLPEGTMSLIIIRNISVIFVVIFVAVVFYLRWKR